MEIPKEQFIQQTKKLLAYMMERLHIKTLPSKLILKNNEENAKEPWGYTGNYNPADKSITLFITDRHHVDILRSFAHEVIHHWQNENGQLLTGSGMEGSVGPGTDNPQYAQKDEHLRKMEKQAYLLGNMIFRDFEDMERYGKTDVVNESADIRWTKWIQNMVSTIEYHIAEIDEPSISEYEAYDILKTSFQSNAPYQDMFQKACKEVLVILKQKGIVN